MSLKPSFRPTNKPSIRPKTITPSKRPTSNPIISSKKPASVPSSYPSCQPTSLRPSSIIPTTSIPTTSKPTTFIYAPKYNDSKPPDGAETAGIVIGILIVTIVIFFCTRKFLRDLRASRENQQNHTEYIDFASYKGERGKLNKTSDHVSISETVMSPVHTQEASGSTNLVPFSITKGDEFVTTRALNSKLSDSIIRETATTSLYNSNYNDEYDISFHSNIVISPMHNFENNNNSNNATDSPNMSPINGKYLCISSGSFNKSGEGTDLNSRLTVDSVSTSVNSCRSYDAESEKTFHRPPLHPSPTYSQANQYDNLFPNVLTLSESAHMSVSDNSTNGVETQLSLLYPDNAFASNNGIASFNNTSLIDNVQNNYDHSAEELVHDESSFTLFGKEEYEENSPPTKSSSPNDLGSVKVDFDKDAIYKEISKEQSNIQDFNSLAYHTNVAISPTTTKSPSPPPSFTDNLLYYKQIYPHSKANIDCSLRLVHVIKTSSILQRNLDYEKFCKKSLLLQRKSYQERNRSNSYRKQTKYQQLKYTNVNQKYNSNNITNITHKDSLEIPVRKSLMTN